MASAFDKRRIELGQNNWWFSPLQPPPTLKSKALQARAHHRLERARADEVGSGEKEKEKVKEIVSASTKEKKSNFVFEGIFATRKTGKTHSPLDEKKPSAPKLPFSLFFLSL